ERVRSLVAVLKEAPPLMAAARTNLADALAKPFIETAIQVAEGSADFLGKDLVDALKDLKNESLRAEFTAANQRAIAELRGFVAFLKEQKLPQAHNHYALGREKFAKMLRAGELIGFSPERVLEIGLSELRREQKVFADTAKKIDPSRKPIEVFKEIQKD